MKMFANGMQIQDSVILNFKIYVTSAGEEFRYRRLCFSSDNCAAGRHSERMKRTESTEERSTVRTRTTYAGAAQSLREAKVEKVQTEGKED